MATEGEPIDLHLPPEPPRDRYITAWHADGRPHGQLFRHNGRAWIGMGTFGFGMSWARIVAWAVDDGLVLTSRPLPEEA
jgi:hypothetical protein